MGLDGKIAGMSFGTRIKGLRVARGLTQVQLSGRAGITQGSLSAIERGNTKGLKAGTILALAKSLGTSPQWLQTGKGSPGEPVTPDPDEAEALHLFRALPPHVRAKWLSNGRWLLAEEGQPASQADPFSKAR